MKRIGLLDVDGHNYPNLALMKISMYHKQKGDIVDMIKSTQAKYSLLRPISAITSMQTH